VLRRRGANCVIGTVLRVDLLAVWLGKLTLLALRLIGRRGNALPGLVVEKVFPRYLARAMARLPEGVVVVTGTNGKTTTTKMLATVLGERLRHSRPAAVLVT
jgi:UDP-N-acetylmuramyl pentapeptide synthase